MPNKKTRKPFSQTWWGKHQPFSLLFVSIPSIADASRRWAFYQIVLSFVFFFAAIGVGFLTVDVSRVSGAIMIIALIFFALAGFALMYAFFIGLYWFYPKYTTGADNGNEAKRVERDDRLHKEIQALIKEIRQDRNERRKRT